MKTSIHALKKLIAGIAFLGSVLSHLHAAPLGTAFTYQGRLADGATPANGLYDTRFTLFDAASGGAQVGTPSRVTVNATPVSNGVFTVSLNFGDAFAGQARWLAIEVKTNLAVDYHPLTPRTELTPAPHALYALRAGSADAVAPGAITSASLAPASVSGPAIADGSIGAADLSPGLLDGTFWKLGGNSGTAPGPNFVGTTDNQPLELRVNNQRALRLEPSAAGPNLIGGGSANVVEPGTGAATISGGVSNRVSGSYGTVGGGQSNAAVWPHTVVGGGEENVAQGFYAVIGGGSANFTGEQGAIVGGGSNNRATGHHSTIAGGSGNTADGPGGAVGGGGGNRAMAQYGTVGGGSGNVLQGTNATIAGGASNLASNNFATVGGGRANIAGGAALNAAFAPFIPAEFSTVSGGESNRARRTYASISGGHANTVTTRYGTIGGGLGNTIHGIENAQSGTNCCEGAYGVIAGGQGNSILGFWNFNSVISGGESNTVISPGSGATLANVAGTIGGGSRNRVIGQYSTVPGGSRNQADGDYSFAAGHRARAGHDGSFVWADDTDADFASTTNKQFAIRANNGVMIQATNTALDLRGGGAVRVAGAGVNSATPVFIHRASAATVSANTTFIDHPHCNGNPNAILIVTHNFSADTAANRYETEPVGVWYNGSRWTIFHENSLVAMPVGRAFNVMVVKP